MATREVRYGPEGRRYTGKWRARVKEDRQEYFLGIFETEEEALMTEERFKSHAAK